MQLGRYSQEKSKQNNKRARIFLKIIIRKLASINEIYIGWDCSQSEVLSYQILIIYKSLERF